MLNIGSERVSRLLPDSLITTHGPRVRKTLFLTFDDGPAPGTTELILEVLGAHDVKGSFFCIGEHLRRSPGVARELSAAGHQLCNHSDTHRNYRRLSLDEQLRDIDACQAELRGVDENAPKVFRAPRGQLGLGSALALRRRGWRIVHWSYDSLDYQKPSLSNFLERFDRFHVRPGDVLLFHDDSRLCADALDTLLPRWKSEGFDFATVAALSA